jgi:putative SOS response-associated peptidase YedK
MCNLYGIDMTWAEYIAHFQAADDWRSQLTVEKDYAAPGKPGWIVRDLDDGRRVVEAMTWGFPDKGRERKRAPAPGQSRLIYEYYPNARDLGREWWRMWIAQPAHRCLVPFTRFAEPKAAAHRTSPRDVNWWFTVTDQSHPCFAGIWKMHEDLGPVYSFLTCEPNALVGPKHPKAMPVILRAEDREQWLTGSLDEALSLQRPYAADAMVVH